LAAAFLLTMRGIPQLSWGDEIGLGGNSEDRRSIPGGWPDDPRNAFTAGGRTPDEQAHFDAFQTLLALRKKHVALRRGSTTELVATDTVYAYLRHQGAEWWALVPTRGEQRIVVLLNFGNEPARFTLPSEPLRGAGRFVRLYGEGTIERDGDGTTIRAAIPAERALIVEVVR
jgi:glycosidase